MSKLYLGNCQNFTYVPNCLNFIDIPKCINYIYIFFLHSSCIYFCFCYYNIIGNLPKRKPKHVFSTILVGLHSLKKLPTNPLLTVLNSPTN